MKYEFWRHPKFDEKRWYGIFRAETNGNVVRHYYRPTIRVLVAGLLIAAVLTFVLLGLSSGLALVSESIGREVPA